MEFPLVMSLENISPTNCFLTNWDNSTQQSLPQEVSNSIDFKYTSDPYQDKVLDSVVKVSVPTDNMISENFQKFSINNTLGLYLDDILDEQDNNLDEGPQSTWTLKETELLLLNVQKYGKQWSKMNINGRSVSSIRNRWARIKPNNQKNGKNRCNKCGLFKRGHICRAL